MSFLVRLWFRSEWVPAQWQLVQEWPVCQHAWNLPVLLWHWLPGHTRPTGLRWWVQQSLSLKHILTLGNEVLTTDPAINCTDLCTLWVLFLFILFIEPIIFTETEIWMSKLCDLFLQILMNVQSWMEAVRRTVPTQRAVTSAAVVRAMHSCRISGPVQVKKQWICTVFYFSLYSENYSFYLMKINK